MSTKDFNGAGKRKTNSSECVNDVGASLDGVPSDFMNEADRNQGAARPDPFGDIEQGNVMPADAHDIWGGSSVASVDSESINLGVAMDGDGSDILTCHAAYLLTGRGECYQCKEKTSLFALMVLPPFSWTGEEDEPMDDEGSMLRDITVMPDSVLLAINAQARNRWRLDYSKTAGESYWMNHCEHCDAKQGDHFVHGVDGPFWPNSDADMDGIESSLIEGPLRFPHANTAYSGAMADWRDRRHGVVREPIKLRKRRSVPAKKD